MADFDIHVDELCMLYEYQQGTLFNGLEYFNTVEESLGLSTPTYIVFVDELAETIGFSESHDPVHMLVLLESLGLEEQFGFPSQVSATSLEVIHGQVVRPVDVCYFGLEVLHGIDIFWEEVSSGLHGTSDAKGVPYHWFTMYESFEALDEDTIVKVTFSTVPDFFNMRHTVEQLYNFNNFLNEQMFTYDWPGLAWGKLIEDGCILGSALTRYLGFVANDCLFTQTQAQSMWNGKQVIDDRMFAYDTGKLVQGFSEAMGETVGITDLAKAPFIEKLMGVLGITGGIEKTNFKISLVLKEAVKIKTALTLALIMLPNVKDGFTVADNQVLAELMVDYLETIKDGFGINIDSALNFVMSKLIEDTLTGNDSALIKWYLDILLAESIDFTEEIN